MMMIQYIIGNTILLRFIFEIKNSSHPLFGTASIQVGFCEPTRSPTALQPIESPFFAHKDEVLTTGFSNKYHKEPANLRLGNSLWYKGIKYTIFSAGSHTNDPEGHRMFIANETEGPEIQIAVLDVEMTRSFPLKVGLQTLLNSPLTSYGGGKLIMNFRVAPSDPEPNAGMLMVELDWPDSELPLGDPGCHPDRLANQWGP
jgi:hypothetical protein